jgi:hypothetical protein
MGRGRLLTCIDVAWDGKSYTTYVVNESPPLAAFGFRHAIPLPIGVPAGCVAMWIALGIRARQRSAGNVQSATR